MRAFSEPGIENGAQPHIGFVAGVDDCVAPRQGNFQRFFNDDVFACLGGGDSGFEMRATRRANADNIQVIAFEHLGVIVVTVDVVSVSEPFRVVGVSGADSDELSVC